MANFKRKRSENQRTGCLMCKPWKVNGFARRRRKDGERFSDYRRRSAAEHEIRNSHETLGTSQSFSG